MTGGELPEDAHIRPPFEGSVRQSSAGSLRQSQAEGAPSPAASASPAAGQSGPRSGERSPRSPRSGGRSGRSDGRSEGAPSAADGQSGPSTGVNSAGGRKWARNQLHDEAVMYLPPLITTLLNSFCKDTTVRARAPNRPAHHPPAPAAVHWLRAR